MDFLMLLATLASLFFAWLAAGAARDAVAVARDSRTEERWRARAAQLERIADLVGQVQDAYMARRVTGLPGWEHGAQADARWMNALGRLSAAIAGTGLELPRSSAVAAGSDDFEGALHEVAEHVRGVETHFAPDV